MPSKKDDRAGNIKLLRQTGGTAKKPVGTWRVRLPIGRGPLGGTPRNLERRVTGAEDDAWDMLAELRKQPKAKAKAKLLAPTTVSEMLDQYLDWLATYKGREATTLASYRAIADRIIKLIGAKQIGTVSRRDIDLIHRQLLKDGKTANTLRRYHAVLTGAFKWARREGLLLEDAALPTELVELPELVKFRADAISVAGALAVVAKVKATDPQMGLALALAVATGCRRGEVLALQWGDVEKVSGGWRLKVRRSVAQVKGRKWFVKDTKTHQDRPLSLDWATVRALAAERARWKRRVMAKPSPTSFVLADVATDSSGLVPHEPDWLTWGWRNATIDPEDPEGKRRLVKARLHDLRHLHATSLLENGVAITTVSKRLGHSKVSTTLDIYSHVTEGKDQEAADTIGRLMKDGGYS